MTITKSFERNGKNLSQRFFVVDGESSWYVCCKNGQVSREARDAYIEGERKKLGENG